MQKSCKLIFNKSYNYNRENKLLWRIWAGFLHYVIVKPVTHLIMLFGYHYKVIGSKKFKEIKKQSCFVYSNHTNYMPDAYIPNHLAYKKVYVIKINFLQENCIQFNCKMI